jgi:virginiamycin A acetyltransferase
LQDVNVINKILNQLKLSKFQRDWRNKNAHNFTKAACFFPMELVEVGKLSYGHLKIRYYGDEKEKLIIKNLVSISRGTEFILGGNHQYDSLFTYPFKSKYFEEGPEATSKGQIILENDVWIGANVQIYSGITIGQGAIVGGGAVVTSSIPPYAIAVGNPAVVKKYRFSEDIIELLLNHLDFHQIDIEKFRFDSEKLYETVNSDNVLQLIQMLK